MAGMGHPSDPMFRTHHALRIKGFATAETVADVAGHDASTTSEHLGALRDRGDAQFREARALWQLTPDGRAAHGRALADDVSGFDLSIFGDAYPSFLALNDEFKSLCGDWQLREGAPNDHSDAAYDAAVIARLVALDARAQPIATSIGDAYERFGPYAPRLARTCQEVAGGETKKLTGVMCGSYHDVWMELHEDLILTQGIDRAKEGSF